MCPETKINCRNFACDWETAISKQFKVCFPEERLIVSFHFKQALRRKVLNQCGFNPDDIALSVQKGYIDLLCVIPHAEVVKDGIPCVWSLLEADLEADDIERCDYFWQYFVIQWVEIVRIENWSIVDKDGISLAIINRTNNALENYNRFFCDMFPTKPVRISTAVFHYPFLRSPWIDLIYILQTFIWFAEGTEKESRRVEERFQDLQECRSKRPNYKEVTIPKLENSGYPAFVKAHKVIENREEAKKKGAAAKKTAQKRAAAK